MGVLFVATFILLINSGLGILPNTCSTDVFCFTDPCQGQTCDKFPSAECRCVKDCKKEFWYNGSNVTGQCSSGKSDILDVIFNTITGFGDGSTGGGTGSDASGCPPGVKPVGCFMEPCSVSSCPGVPGATCKNNYCGSCIADYYLGNQKVTDRCTKICPSGQAPVNCAARPCSTAKCPRYQDATCQDNYCGGCKAQFFAGKTEVTSKCHHNCPQGQPYTPCNFSPCRVSTCVRFPNAVCVDSNCGGCFAKFYYQKREVTSQCKQQPRQQRLPPWYYWMFSGMF